MANEHMRRHSVSLVLKGLPTGTAVDTTSHRQNSPGYNTWRLDLCWT